jgi:hypothetical protein
MGSASGSVSVKMGRVPLPCRSNDVIQARPSLPAENLIRAADVGEEGNRIARKERRGRSLFPPPPGPPGQRARYSLERGSNEVRDFLQ